MKITPRHKTVITGIVLTLAVVFGGDFVTALMQAISMITPAA